VNRPVKVLVVSLLVCVMAVSVGSVAAMNEYQNGGLDQVQLREQLQDCSCCEAESIDEQQQNMARTQTREQLQEQLKDGNCTETGPLQERIQDRIQEQLSEQLRDGSCSETGNVEEPLQETTQERNQLQEQFRHGYTE